MFTRRTISPMILPTRTSTGLRGEKGDFSWKGFSWPLEIWKRIGMTNLWSRIPCNKQIFLNKQSQATGTTTESEFCIILVINQSRKFRNNVRPVTGLSIRLKRKVFEIQVSSSCVLKDCFFNLLNKQRNIFKLRYKRPRMAKYWH